MKKLLATLLVLPMLVFSGCATLGGGETNTALEYFNKYQHIMRLGTQVAVLAVLDQNPTYAPKVADFAEYLTEALDGQDIVDLKELEQMAVEKIDWSKYNPTERLLVEALITQIRVEIENVIAANKLSIPTPPEDIKMVVTSFLGWVKEGALVFQQQQGNRNVIPTLPPIQ